MNKTEEFMKPKISFGNALKFTPYAWSKLLYMRDRGPTEVAGYGVTETNDPLLVTDFILIKQECTIVTFDLDPEDATEYIEKMTNRGIPPWACQNILIHTHPGDCPSPSGVDEINFNKAFTHPNWAMMFIIAEGGKCYCRLKINIGPGLIKELDVLIDWSLEFKGTDQESWNKEYLDKVKETVSIFKMTGKEGTKDGNANSFQGFGQINDPTNIDDPFWSLQNENRWERVSQLEDEELSQDSQSETQIDEEIDFDCHWDADGEVVYWDEYENIWYSYNPIKKQWYKENTADDSEMIAIAMPNKEWALKVVEWAYQFAEERLLALEN